MREQVEFELDQDGRVMLNITTKDDSNLEFCI